MKPVFILCLILLFAVTASAQQGTKKKRPLPYDYGKVVINNYSQNAGLAPVTFAHWSHRAKYTCRLCHVDLGFAMKAGATDIKATDNIKGYYCGTCHNGRMFYDGKKIFEACSRKFIEDDKAACERCHFSGKQTNKEADFHLFSEKLPKERFGNGIDWEKAEAESLLKLIDFIEGVSIKRQSLKIQNDFALNPKVKEMPDIIFSHMKHTVWNGCEVCHPEIFVGVKKGTTRYSMVEIFEGKYCGACHGKVSFPLIDCQRCHTKQP